MHRVSLRGAGVLCALLCVAMTWTSTAQLVCGTSRTWASLIGQRLEAVRDVPYRTVDGIPLKVDLYVPYHRSPGPTVLYIHGGGWQSGSREQYVIERFLRGHNLLPTAIR